MTTENNHPTSLQVSNFPPTQFVPGAAKNQGAQSLSTKIEKFWDCKTIRWCKDRRQAENLSLFQLWNSFEIPEELRTVESLSYLAQKLEIRIDADDSDFKPALLSIAPNPEYSWDSPQGSKALKAIKSAMGANA
jgi:hypothetical protein